MTPARGDRPGARHGRRWRARAQAPGAGRRRAGRGAPAAAPNTLGPAGTGRGFGEAHADRARCESRRCMRRIRPSSIRWWRTCCCRISTVEYAARLVLGQTWRTATPEQRKRFVDAFYHSLLRNYGNALLNFTADQVHGPAVQRRSRRHDGHRAHRGEEVRRRKGAGQFQSCTRPIRAGRPGTS